MNLPQTQGEAIAAFPELAAKLEFESWLDVLREQREVYCPSGHRHVVDTSTPPPGLYGVCARCGHEIDLPF